jgi:hypothetical protein
MANKKVSELPVITSLRDDDIIVMNQLGTTGTASLSSIGNKVTSNYIPKPATTAGNDGDMLIYQNSTSSWVPSAPNFIPKPATTAANNGGFLTYQHSTQSWIAGDHTINVPDFFICAEKPNENTTVNEINDSYANDTWTNIKTLTKLPWASYFGIKNPTAIKIALQLSETEVMTTVGHSISFTRPSGGTNEGETTVNSKQYFFQEVQANNNSWKYFTLDIPFDEDGTAYIKIRKVDPKTFWCRIYLLGATF